MISSLADNELALASLVIHSLNVPTLHAVVQLSEDVGRERGSAA